MGGENRHAGNVKLLGGMVCLDFVNTLDWRGIENPRDFLNTFQDLTVWCRRVDIVTNREAKKLLRQAADNPRIAETVRKRAVELREAGYRIFSSVADGKAPDNCDLALFNDYLSRTMAHSRIIETETGFSLDSDGDKEGLDWILNPIIRSSTDLLISDELGKVKKCADADCSWLFLDISRNRSRRWCDMKSCGNRAKARRFYKKRQNNRS